MNYDVGVTPRARHELRQVANWYAERSGSQEIADRWVTGVFAIVDELQVEPQRYPLARESSLFDYDVREVYYDSGRRKTHRILFRVLDDLVEIMAIRHFAQRDISPDDL